MLLTLWLRKLDSGPMSVSRSKPSPSPSSTTSAARASRSGMEPTAEGSAAAIIPPVEPDVEIVSGGGRRLKAAVARPDARGEHPGVVVIHEVFGDQPEMRGMCEEFAHRGYVTVMPDLFAGHGPHPICVARTMIDASRGRVNADIDAARAWLAAQEQVDGERIGAIRFCMGGGFVLAYVGGSPPGVRAAAVNYGPVNYGPVPRKSSALRGACPVIASYGARDKMIGRAHAERLDATFRRWGSSTTSRSMTRRGTAS